MKLQFNERARVWHKLWSIRFAILSAFFGAIPTAYNTLPGDWLPEIPHGLKVFFGLGSLFTAGAAAISVVVKQAGLETPATPVSVPPPQS